MTEETKRRPLTFGERFAITFILLWMALSGACTAYILATSHQPRDNLGIGLTVGFGGGFQLLCVLALLVTWLRIWWVRGADK